MKSEKVFDAVKMMREIRDKISKEFINMSYKEQKKYIEKRVKVKSKTTQNAKKDINIA